ncbi:MAG: hypothetical protein V7L30_21475, partial [Nostoc sp.]|uniref:hypothetical protein n=1 Tax=Nostoc sp. TaxID=1180 RepID=UPI002FFA68D0
MTSREQSQAGCNKGKGLAIAYVGTLSQKYSTELFTSIEYIILLDLVGSRCALLHHPSHSEPCLRFSPHTATQC